MVSLVSLLSLVSLVSLVSLISLVSLVLLGYVRVSQWVWLLSHMRPPLGPDQILVLGRAFAHIPSSVDSVGER